VIGFCNKAIIPSHYCCVRTDTGFGVYKIWKMEINIQKIIANASDFSYFFIGFKSQIGAQKREFEMF
jgi:hypothetical protein